MQVIDGTSANSAKMSGGSNSAAGTSSAETSTMNGGSTNNSTSNTTTTTASVAPTTVSVKTSSYSRVVEYFMCGNKEKDANGMIKGLRFVYSY